MQRTHNSLTLGSNPSGSTIQEYCMSKKFTFDDLQPPAEMLIEALANKGACASGYPYAPGVAELSASYNQLLTEVRNKKISYEDLTEDLNLYSRLVMKRAGNNQRHRLDKIVTALDIYIKKEYNKIHI